MKKNTKLPFFAIKERRITQFKNENATPKSILFKGSKNKEKMQRVHNYFTSRLILNEAFAHAPNGIYTWLMKIVPDSGMLFVAGLTKSNQELGTLHSNLDKLTVKGRVVGAGELIKENGSIRYNLQSGSYMEDAFTKTDDKDALKTRIDEAFISIMNGLGFNDITFMASDEPGKEYIGEGIVDMTDFNTSLGNIENYKGMFNYEYRGGASSYAKGGGCGCGMQRFVGIGGYRKSNKKTRRHIRNKRGVTRKQKKSRKP
jgi:hypothetical protein